MAKQLQVAPVLLAETADEHQLASALDGQVGVPIGNDVADLIFGQEGELPQVVLRRLIEVDGVAMDFLQKFVEVCLVLRIVFILSEELLDEIRPCEGCLCPYTEGAKTQEQEEEL